MSLIKKTFVLTDRTPKGYVTLVRVGNESGAKIVGETFTQGMKAYLRIGRQSQTVTLAGKRTETELDVELSNADAVSCVVYSEGKIIATGGKELTEREKNALIDGKNVKSDEDEKKDKTPFAETASTAAAEIVEPETEETEVSEEGTDPSAESEQGVTEEGQNRRRIEEETTEENAEGGEDPAPESENESRTESGGERSAESDENDMLVRLKEEKSGYYLGISDKIDELFVVYPNEKLLEEAIPDSEWVKVNYDGDDYYVVGKLKENDKVRYLGYGVPGVAEIKPPKVADGIASWFPLGGLNGYDGYWLFFQDAETGRIDG